MSMRFYKEKIETDLLIPAKIYIGNSKGENCHYPLHWHNNLEFVLVLCGEIKGKINNKYIDVKCGEIFFVNSGELHETWANDKNKIKAITILLSYELLKKYFPNIDSYYFDFEEKEDSKEKIKDLIVKCGEIYTNKENFYELNMSIVLMELCNILFKECLKEKEVGNIYNIEEKREINIKRAITYMEDNYDLDLSLSDISREIGMAPTYFSRFFKKNTGETFYSYLKKIRLYHSYKELINTEASITEIALNNGFSNVKSFIEIFKKAYNNTPAKYRNESKRIRLKDNN